MTVKCISAIICCTLLSIAAVPAVAQHRTPAEQELVAAMEECWTLNKEADIQASVQEWSDQCWASDEMQFWWAEQSTPNSTRVIRRGISTGLWMWGYKRWDWTKLRPLAITIDGDFAFVYYNVTTQTEDAQGQYAFQDQRRFEVWKMVDGRWKFLGGMGAAAN
jgi:hypothetical protein